jgi:acyl-CoA synthetase (AMP-forming)/AMP-acid ligase II
VLTPLVLRDFLRRAEIGYRDAVGLLDEPVQPAAPLGPLTYGAVADLARRQAARLDSLGVGAGERVAFVSHNSARLLTAFFGVSGWGRILVPINFRLRPEEVQYIVDHSGARVLYVDPELWQAYEDVRCEHKFILGDDDVLYAPPGAQPQPWEQDESAVATINYTSGTTARPKGVELTHRNLWLNATVFGLHTTVSDRDVYLHTLPLFHVNGWGMPFIMAGVGAQQILLRKVDGEEILRRVRDHGVTIMCAAPAVAASVLEAAERWKGEIPGRGQVRIVIAGAPPPSETVARIETELGWEFIQIYGLTEASPLLTINRSRPQWEGLDSLDRARLLTRAGLPALGVELATAETDDGVGEIMARSNGVMNGYWRQPEETADAVVDGWFRTGDGGEVGPDGYLVIGDRKKDVIITGGENVSSIEVEDCLFSHPCVAEVAVIGVPSPKWGETIKALVVLKASADQETEWESELIGWCKTRLAGYKAPTSVEIRTDLARTATGKLQKFKLREPYWRDRPRQVN